MRRSLAVLLFAAASASAAPPTPVIYSVSPDRVEASPMEMFINVRGKDFRESATVVIKGAVGEWRLLPNMGAPWSLHVWVPLEVVSNSGIYSVTVWNHDEDGEPAVASNAARFTVTGGAPPALFVPDRVVVEATGPSGAKATYTVESDGEVLCAPASGATFPVGTTTVSCFATNHNGRTRKDFPVVVTDTTPPVMTLPSDITVEATSEEGAVVFFEATATDLVDGDVPVSCHPESGSLFPIGSNSVNCSAVDRHHNAAIRSFLIHVVDNARPMLMLPPDMTVEATGPDGAVVTFNATAMDYKERTIPVTCTPESGSLFPIGTTTVTCSATDDRERTSTGTFEVTVTEKEPPPPPPDTTAPFVHHIAVSPDTLWPPNQKLVEVTVTVVASDDTDPAPLSQIVEVRVSESVKPGDWRITGALTADLRADRNDPKVERVYTLVIATSDESGNTTTNTIAVRVPHDQSDSEPVAPQPPRKRRAVGRRG